MRILNNRSLPTCFTSRQEFESKYKLLTKSWSDSETPKNKYNTKFNKLLQHGKTNNMELSLETND